MLFIHRQAQIIVLAVFDIDIHLFRDRFPQLDRIFCERQIRLFSVALTNAARATPRAFHGEVLFLDEANVNTLLRQVVGQRNPNDASTDNDHIMRFNVHMARLCQNGPRPSGSGIFIFSDPKVLRVAYPLISGK